MQQKTITLHKHLDDKSCASETCCTKCLCYFKLIIISKASYFIEISFLKYNIVCRDSEKRVF